MRSEVTSWKLYSDQFAFYASPADSKVPIDPDSASSKTMLYVQKAYDENRVTIETHLQNLGYRFERECVFDSFSTVKRLAVRGMGIAVLPTRLASEDLAKRQLAHIFLKGFRTEGFGRHSIYATAHQRNESEFRIKKLVTLLRSHFRDSR